MRYISYAVTRDALRRERLLFRVTTITLMTTREFYAAFVEDMKTALGHHVAEPVDADELVYLVRTEVECVVLSEVRIGVHPQLRETAQE